MVQSLALVGDNPVPMKGRNLIHAVLKQLYVRNLSAKFQSTQKEIGEVWL